MTSQVEVIARAQAKPGKEDELARVLATAVAPTRKEAGCIVYRLCQTQTKGLFYFYEIWQSQAALDAHAASDHLKAMKELAKDLLLGPTEVSLLTEID